MLLYGRNVIKEILKNGNRQVYEIYTAKGAKGLDDIINDIKGRKIKHILKDHGDIDEMTGTDKNQGIAAKVEGVRGYSIEEFLEKNKDAENVSAVILDEITDPHNAGAIIRSCEVFGVNGVVVPELKSAPINDTVYKASSGAIEYVDIIKVSNINNAVEKFKKAGFWIYGLDADGEKDVSAAEFDKKTVLVLGSEGKGLKQLVKKNCDFLVKIPQKGKIDSLNVSNAAAVAFYELMKQRKS